MLDAGVVNTEQELTETGRSLLPSAKARAAEQDVATGTYICTGEMLGDVKHTPRKEDVSLVALGQPAGEESVWTGPTWRPSLMRSRTKWVSKLVPSDPADWCRRQ
jgi:hypothetical protein